MYKAVVFDFDGVLFDSVNVKTEAFRILMSPYGDLIADKAVAYHLKHGGISRYKKLRYFHEVYVGESVTDKFINVRAEQFSNLVLEGVVNAKWINGAMESVKSLFEFAPLYICSGTPENELREIVERKRIGSFFKNIYGSPAEKTEILIKICEELQADPLDIVFIGDSITDYHAARDTGVPFIGLGEIIFAELNVTTLRNMNELFTLISERNVKIP
jgi:phosphoglycolate phosphatase-like HAD superfamily hydrolase